MGFNGGAAFIPVYHGNTGTAFQLCSQRFAFFCPFALGSIHIFRQTHDNFLDFFTLDQRRQFLQQFFGIPGGNDLRGTGKKTGRVGNGDTGAGIAVINSHNFHWIAIPFGYNVEDSISHGGF